MTPVASRPVHALVLDPDDPDAMTAEARSREVAAILATGYLRMLASSRPGAPEASVSQPSESMRSRENELAVLGDHERVCAPRERS